MRRMLAPSASAVALRQNSITLNGDTFLTDKEVYVSLEASRGGLGSTARYGSRDRGRRYFLGFK